MATAAKTEGGVANPGALHGGRLAAKALRDRGVTHLFTLSGGHLFSLYDGCREEGIAVIDVRHEQAAAFAAEGWAKATRTPGVCALTAGPGVTNGVSAMASAAANGTPIVVLGGRAAEGRWGSGSLQEIDHLPFVSPLVKSAETVKDPAAMPVVIDAIEEAAELLAAAERPAIMAGTGLYWAGAVCRPTIRTPSAAPADSASAKPTSRS